MKALTCAATRRRLQAFHDEELDVADQIAVGAHLEWCDACAGMVAEMRLLRSALRANVRQGLSDEEGASFQAAVLSGMRAERTVSLSARIRGLIEDRHLVYVGFGAAVATLVCVVGMLTMMHFATSARPDSLAALVNILGTSGSTEVPVPVAARVLMPQPLDASFPTSMSLGDGDGDAVFMLAAVVTREGTVANLELIHALSGRPVAPGSEEAKAAKGLMGAVSRARFEPARVDGLPVAVNMMWTVANASMRPVEQPLEHRTPPAAKRRVV